MKTPIALLLLLLCSCAGVMHTSHTDADMEPVRFAGNTVAHRTGVKYINENGLPEGVGFLEVKFFKFCGATLVAPDRILTAQHCVVNLAEGVEFTSHGEVLPVQGCTQEGEGTSDDFSICTLGKSSKQKPHQLADRSVFVPGRHYLHAGTTLEDACGGNRLQGFVVDSVNTTGAMVPMHGFDFCPGDSGSPVFEEITGDIVGVAVATLKHIDYHGGNFSTMVLMSMPSYVGK